MLVTNTLVYRAISKVIKEINCCENDTRGYIYNTVFSSYLMNGPNKLKCYFTLIWKGLLETNTGLLDHLRSYEEKEVFGI
jgi:hypothetical protein